MLPANGSCVPSPLLYEGNNIRSTSVMQSRTSVLLLAPKEREAKVTMRSLSKLSTLLSWLTLTC